MYLMCEFAPIALQPSTGNRGGHGPQEAQTAWTIRYIVAAGLGIILLQDFSTACRQTETIPYSEFEQLVSDNKVAEVVVGSDTIQGTPAGAKTILARRRADLDREPNFR